MDASGHLFPDFPVVVGVITYFLYEFIRRRSTLFYYVACGLLLVALGGQAAGVKARIDVLWGAMIRPPNL